MTNFMRDSVTPQERLERLRDIEYDRWMPEMSKIVTAVVIATAAVCFFLYEHFSKQ